MKNAGKWIAALLVSAACLLGVYCLYTHLSGTYTPDSLTPSGDKSENPQKEEPSANSSQNPEEEVAHPAPDFTVTDADGNKVKLSDYFGKPIILNFWASWCYYCKQEMPDFENAYLTHGDDIHFLMLNVTDGSRETVDSARQYIEESGYTFPVYFDTTLEAAMTYGASGLPVTFFIDADGNLFTYVTGKIPQKTLDRCIELLLEEK